jgi:16S rRNA (uracil1498-N3)-methyltransferase
VFVDGIEGGSAVARGAQAHHLARVARLRAGEQVEVSDQVTAYRALTESCTPTEVRFRIDGALPAEPEFPRLGVVLAIVKFARFEWAVEKLTELGVHSITPLIAARSDAKLVQSAEKRSERWRRIALEAAQQSRRLAAPTVAVPMAFADAVQDCRSDTRLLAEPAGPSVSSFCCGHETTLLVGPEGGWTQQESQLAHECGFRAASLGRNVLRAETAAVALAAICASRSGAESER